jgi:hypothetical protein
VEHRGRRRRGRVEQQQPGGQAGLIDGQAQRDQPAQAVPDDDQRAADPHADGAGQLAGVFRQPQRPLVAGGADAGDIDPDDLCPGSQGCAELGEIPVDGGRAAGNEQHLRSAEAPWRVHDVPPVRMAWAAGREFDTVCGGRAG